MLESEQQTAATTAARRSSSSTSTKKKTSGRAGLLSRTSLKKKSSNKAKKGMSVCSRFVLCFPRALCSYSRWIHSCFHSNLLFEFWWWVFSSWIEKVIKTTVISNSSRDHTTGTTIQFEGGRTLQFNKNEPAAASTVATTSSPSTASPSSQQSCSLSPDKPSTTTTSLPSIYSSSSWTNSDYNKLKMEFEGGAPYSEYSKTLKTSSPPPKPISTNGSGSGGAKVSFSVHAGSSTKNSSIYNNSLHSINTSDTTLTGAVSLHDNLMLAKKKDPYKYYEVIKIMGTSSHNTTRILHVFVSVFILSPALCTVGRRYWSILEQHRFQLP